MYFIPNLQHLSHFFYTSNKVQLNFTLKSDNCKQDNASVVANIQNSQNISPIQNRQESKKDFLRKVVTKEITNFCN